MQSASSTIAQGNTYAIETVPSEKLMQLVYGPLPAYA
jgi:hypothetical protein